MSRLNFSNLSATPISSLMNNQQSNYPNGYAMTQPVSNNISSQNVGYNNNNNNNIQQFTNFGSGTQQNEVEDIKNILNNTQTQLQKYGNDIVNMQNMMSQMDFKKMYQTILDIPKVLVAQSQMPNRTMRSLNLIVSSADRDLSNLQFNKYNFRVTFGAESNQKVVSYNNVYNQQIGRDISYSTTTYKSSGLLNPNLQQVIKNVISVKLKRVVIPRPRYEVFNPEPFYYVIIDELDSNIYATKTFSHKIFSKIVYDDHARFYPTGYPDISGREYLYYTNEDDDVAYYYPSPLAKLDRLTIKLVNSEGRTLDLTGGFEDIDYASLSSGSGNTFQSVTSKFDNNTFLRDKILNIQSGTISRISNVNNTASPNTYTLKESISASSGNTIVNLSNQIEYVFEVKTVEFDVNSGIQPIL
jgi:hypothetical protein